MKQDCSLTPEDQSSSVRLRFCLYTVIDLDLYCLYVLWLGLCKCSKRCESYISNIIFFNLILSILTNITGLILLIFCSEQWTMLFSVVSLALLEKWNILQNEKKKSNHSQSYCTQSQSTDIFPGKYQGLWFSVSKFLASSISFWKSQKSYSCFQQIKQKRNVCEVLVSWLIELSVSSKFAFLAWFDFMIDLVSFVGNE